MIKLWHQLFKIQPEGDRIFGLDLLRALAIASVIYAHSSIFIEVPNLKTTLLLFTIDGVTAFFVLSGFLIGQIVMRDFEKKPANWRTAVSF